MSDEQMARAEDLREALGNLTEHVYVLRNRVLDDCGEVAEGSPAHLELSETFDRTDHMLEDIRRAEQLLTEPTDDRLDQAEEYLESARSTFVDAYPLNYGQEPDTSVPICDSGIR